MITVEQFNGPLQPLDVAYWLTSCEDHFEDESSGSLADKDKIRAAGRAIARSGQTQRLHDWFLENRSELEEQTWEEFKEALKDDALGKGWRIHALKDFFTTTHDGKTLEEYFKALDHKRFLLKRNDPFLEPLHEYLYKCYLLFHAPPALVDQVLKDQVYYDDKNFLTARPADVKAWLRKYDNGAINAPSHQVSGTYMPTGLPGEPTLWGFRQWSDMSYLPDKTTAVGHLASLTVGWVIGGQNVMGGYEFRFTDMTVKPSQYFGNVRESQTLSLDTGEYITSIKVSYGIHSFNSSNGTPLGTSTVVKGLEIRSSNTNKVLSLGDFAGTNNPIITAPSGFRIVGFYGSHIDDYTSGKLHIADFVLRLGAIILPL